MPGLAAALRAFVTNGGTLYASDLRFDTLAAAFPEAVDAVAVAQGLKQNLRAAVVSPELRDLIGDEMPLHFDLDGWRPAAFRGDSATVYLTGKFRTTAGVTIDAPLLVKFPAGKGTVLFTSFHNEKQNSELETRLLKHLVFSTVTAGVEATVTRSMVSGGLSLQKTSLLSAAPGDPSVTRTYQHARPGNLAFTLGFEARGARLRLDVVSPAGDRSTKRGESTVTIDIPQAAAGSWTYTVTPESLPYPNFPFTLSIGAVSLVDAREKLAGTNRASVPHSTAVASTSPVRFHEIDLTARQPARAMRIAVTTSRFDDMGRLLRSLGEGYRYETLSIDDLQVPTSLDRFDILFLTCDAWAWGTFAGEFGRPGVSFGTYPRAPFERLAENVRRFVTRGGTLYASDFRYTVVAAAFPRFVQVPGGLLRELEQLEREWLDRLGSKSSIGTIRQAIQGTALSRSFSERMDQVVNALEGSGLADESGPSMADLVKALRSGGVSPLDSDVDAIGRALGIRANTIKGALARARPRSIQVEVRALRNRLRGLRERVAAVSRGTGEKQEVAARVVDPGLQELLGETVSLNFDTSGWDAARFDGKDVAILMRGEFLTLDKNRVESPLLVKFKEGQGTVIFTSFHNEAQNSRQEEALLKYLVFSAITAKEQEVADKTMLSGGFSPARRSLISHSSGQPSVTRTYQSPSGAPLRFALSFSGGEARLKLTLVAPTGQVYEKEARATLVVEAEGAPAGEWRYTVTAIQVPYENFPFSISVGERDPPASPR